MQLLSPKPVHLLSGQGLSQCFETPPSLALVPVNRSPEIHVINLSLLYSCKISQLRLQVQQGMLLTRKKLRV